MANWRVLFSLETWKAFLERGGETMGFADRKWATVQKIQPGDSLICYMIREGKFFAILEVTGKPFRSTKAIAEDANYPARVNVTVTLSLSPELAVPVKKLIGQLSYLPAENSKTWGVHFRGLPKPEKESDAEIIIAALHTAEGSRCGPIPPAEFSHDQIQWLLLSLGSAMKLDLWVANNDRNKSFQGKVFSEIPRLRRNLPVQFDQKTQRIIELIDVLWLQGNSIIAAFEIEHTTSIFSGLLRMSDLMALQPNLNISLFIVAPDDRRDKVKSEINRPTFARLKLPQRCCYIAYSRLTQKFEQATRGGFLRHLSPSILDELADDMSK